MKSGFIDYQFKKTSPEEVGVDSAAINEFIRLMSDERLGLQGYMIYKNGRLAAADIASPYRFTDKRHVYSISKSYTSTAVGIAVDEGLLTVDDRVLDFFPEYKGKTCENLEKMKVCHLLSMNTGHDVDTLGRVATTETGWAERFLSLDVEHEPGTHFAYNSTATYMLSAIITRLTGMRVVDYLKPRFFNPLGISGVWWEESPDRISDGGWGIHVSPEDMLKLGVLYLNRGMFNGRRILSENWVDDALAYHSDNSRNGDPDWKVGYGYQFWLCRHNSFRGDGAFGQYIIMSPEKSAVTVIISECEPLQRVLDIYWETIFASMSDRPLAAAASDVTKIPPFSAPPTGSSPRLEPVSYRLSKNDFGLDKITLSTSGDELILGCHSQGERAVELVLGHNRWEYNKLQHCPILPSTFISRLSSGVAAEVAAAWAARAGKLYVTLQFVTTPHALELVIDPTGGSLSLTRSLQRGQTPVQVDLL